MAQFNMYTDTIKEFKKHPVNAEFAQFTIVLLASAFTASLLSSAPQAQQSHSWP